MECQLRHWRLEDAAAFAAAINNKKIQDNLRDGFPYPYTKKDAIVFIQSVIDADPNDTFAFAITVNDKVVGNIGIFRQENIHSQTAEMGYFLGEDYWGNGIMSSAVKKACDMVFSLSNIIRIYAEPFAYNEASCHVLENCGFMLEGTMRKNAVKNGQVIDMNLYSLIRPDYM